MEYVLLMALTQEHFSRPHETCTPDLTITLGQKKISKKQIESLQGLSAKIHDTRLQALYVDFDEGGPLLPSEVISEPQAQNLIDLATSRLEMEKLHKFGEIDDSRFETLNWFIKATSDQEKRNLIFGNKSMDKLVELQSTRKWVDWLKQEFDKAEKEGQDAIRQELQRKPPKDSEKLQEKWKVKIRLFTNSHSIRPKPLNKWNELGSWIRLYPVGSKKNGSFSYLQNRITFLTDFQEKIIEVTIATSSTYNSGNCCIKGLQFCRSDSMTNKCQKFFSVPV